MTLATADVKSTHAELHRLGRLLESKHPWPEVMLQAGYAGALLLQLAPQAETELERRAIVLGLQAMALAAELTASRP